MADFDAHVTAQFGAGPRALGDEALWRRVADAPEFWTGIPLKEEARDLWNLAKDHDPTFLTGCSRSDFDRAAALKRDWVRADFGDVPVITCLSRDKAAHLSAPGDILVDGFIANVRRWHKVGGHAILYRTSGQAVWDLARALSRAEDG